MSLTIWRNLINNTNHMIQGNSQVKMHTQGKTHMMNLSIFQRCYNTILPAVEVTLWTWLFSTSWCQNKMIKIMLLSTLPSQVKHSSFFWHTKSNYMIAALGWQTDPQQLTFPLDKCNSHVKTPIYQFRSLIFASLV